MTQKIYLLASVSIAGIKISSGVASATHRNHFYHKR